MASPLTAIYHGWPTTPWEYYVEDYDRNPRYRSVSYDSSRGSL